MNFEKLPSFKRKLAIILFIIYNIKINNTCSFNLNPNHEDKNKLLKYHDGFYKPSKNIQLFPYRVTFYNLPYKIPLI